MSDDTELNELLSRWVAARRDGTPIQPEDLCRECPERLDDLRRQIELLELLRPLLGGDPTASPDPAQTHAAGAGADTALVVVTGAAGRYRPVRPHAKGGLGEVLVAQDDELNRAVALKRIRDRYADDAASRQRFLREAEVTARLQHPGVVPVYGLTWDDRGRPCYAMRLVEGETLSDAIGRFHAAARPPQQVIFEGIEFRQLLQRLVQVCNTIAYAHSRGIVHRDLKPQNIMLGKFAETLVVDWGLAKPFDRSDADRVGMEETLTPASDGGEATEVGQAVGTPAYMSPEQADGDSPSPASDIFGLGATLYALLTGQALYQGRAAVALERAKRRDFTPPRKLWPGVPAALEAVCLKALAHRPAERYASAKELADDLERWLADEPVHAHPEPWAVRARRWAKRHRPLVVAAVVALVMVTLGLAWRAARDRDEKRWLDTLRQAAEAARDETTEHFAVARQAVRKLLTELADTPLLDQPGLEPFRRRLGEEARRTLERFLAVRGDEPGLRRERAGVLLLLGHLAESQGDFAPAVHAFDEALAAFEALARERPDDPSLPGDLAWGHNGRGVALRHWGRPAEALPEFRAAEDIWSRLTRERPRDRGVQLYWASVPINVGNCLDDLHRPEEARRAYETALERLESVPSEELDPRGRRDLRHGLAGCLYNLGRINAGRGTRTPDDLTLAARRLGRAAELRRELLRDGPGLPAGRSDLATALLQLGGVYRDLDRTADAEAAFTEAKTLLTRLTRLYPELPRYREDLSAAQNGLAVIYEAAGRLDDAERNYLEAVRLLDELASEVKDPAPARRQAASFRVNLGYLYRTRRRFPEAEAVLRTALEQLPPADAKAVANPEQASLAANAALGLGEVHLQAGHPRAARTSLEASREEWQQLHAAAPRVPYFALGLAECDLNLGHLARAERQPAAAQAAYDRAIERLAKLQSDSEARRFLMDARAGRAQALAAAGHPTEAAAAAYELLRGDPAGGETAYRAAAVYAGCAAAAADGPERERYAARAVELLRQAVANGYKDSGHMKNDPDLEPLRSRPDFQKLLAGLEPAGPPR
jgi:serine/threonine-protein kinase